MSSIVKVKNQKTGITYVYESESYWDKDLKQPRNHRKLIGKLNDKGEVVPTGRRGRPRKTSEGETLDTKTAAQIQEESQSYARRCQELEMENSRLRQEVAKMRQEKENAGSELKKYIEKYFG